ncbi:choice-of-anchor D domain-containing protein [Ichthyenterobacterium sp. W332]|uniref:Choice-of-anchor D domain-containing protein n=1 Tax=Microcosmobacter mediterraneus TaxID=3075607 RepID=A0ABU2YQ59_9FLAO|nr:choice-of-anchor D domain-containing protein [Ichthyenterobacterium sp. W332]MDT0559405.1 choice-of-anchor D domain-containing protein [Ichthyenterobacterium sp. W332]
MKTFTLSIREYITLFGILLFAQLVHSQTTINTDNFNSGNFPFVYAGPPATQWNSGGTNCNRRNPGQDSPTGSNSIRLRNGTGTSLMTTSNINLSTYTTVDFSFLFIASGMEVGERFEVQFWDGSTWNIVTTYTSGTDFNNGVTYTPTLTLTSGSPYTFATTSQFRIRNFGNQNNDKVFFDDVLIEGYAAAGPEINITGLGTTINDGDTTPSLTDDTDFGDVDTASGTNVNTFTIQNTGTASLSVGTITISGANASDFTVTSGPATSVSAGGNTTFNITFNPSADGIRTASVSIVNGDSDENPYNFDIEGTGTSPSYCNSNGNSTADEYIGRVQLNTIDNSTGAGITSTGYSDYTGINTTVTQTTSYTITITPTWSGAVFNEGYSVWVDWNQDLDFGDAGEQVFTTGPTNTTPVSGSFTIPGTANLGSTRMRVSMKYNGIPTECESFGYGEVEDYTIIINPAPSGPEINITGLGNNINDGDTTPSLTDDTDFGTVNTPAGVNVNTFTIQNTGTTSLSVGTVTISGTHAADFSLVSSPASSVASGGNTTFSISFDPSADGLRTANISIINNDTDENPYNFNIQGTGFTPTPEINITGLGNTITDGDTTPSLTDDTDFGDVDTASGTNVNTFTIQNTGTASLSVGTITISGANAADFTVTSGPASSVSAGGNTTFNITFNPSADGLRTASVSIVNGDSDENPYNFDIEGTGFTPTPEINITGLGNTITDGDTTPSLTDDTDFGDVVESGGATNVNTFTIENTGTASLSVGAITISGTHASDFTVTSSPASSVTAGGSTSFDITFNPSAIGLRTASVSIVNGDSNENPYNFNIQGTGTLPSYCTSNGNLTYDTGVTRVQFNTIDNSDGSPKDNAYEDFTAINTNVNQSTSYNLSVNVDTDGNYTVHAWAWIDWNQNGDFGDAGEAYDLGDVTNVSNGATDLSPLSITIPGTASLGTTRMRVSAKFGTDPSYCETGFDGEVEDYTIIVDPAAASPEMDVYGNGLQIVDGDTTPNLADDTDFGSTDITVGSVTNTFTIRNTGTNILNLTGTGPTFVAISGAHAGDFTVTANPSTPVGIGSNTTFNITFNPSAVGLRTATITIANDDLNENPYNFDIQGTGFTNAPEINILGNGITIADGDNTPNILDDTDFGNIDITSGSDIHTFTIQNTGSLNPLTLTGGSPYISVSGAHSGDFSVTAAPTSTILAGSSTTFDITFNPSALGLRSATLTIANNDSDENPYSFAIQGTGTDICGGYVTTYPYSEDFEIGLGQIAQDGADDFNWTRQTGYTNTNESGPSSASSGSYYLYTEANLNNNFTANLFTPCLDLTGTSNPRLTFYFHMHGIDIGTINVDLSTDSGSTYPNNLWSQTTAVQGEETSSWIPVSIDLSSYIGQTVKLRIQGNVGNGNKGDMAIDNLIITDRSIPTEAPGGMTTDISLWLKANDGLSYTDGQSVALWEDQGVGANAKPHTSGQEPTYRDNVNKNINFNPVVEFDNTFASFSLDDDFEHSDTSTEFLEGDFGYFTEELFIVIIPDDTAINNSFGFMDVICGDSDTSNNQTDTTGIGFGDFSGRISNEIICYAHSTYTQTEPGDGYAVSEIGTGSSYDNVGIINTRRNTGNTQQELFYNANDIGTNQNDVPEFLNSDDTRYWIGRSKGWKATTNARIAEVISFKDRLNDTDLTEERNRVQSYLAIKYGITLGSNGTSQDYVDSDGTVIWDQNTGVPAEDVFNYDIAGIGRDDASNLLQKQSRSVNNDLDGASRGRGVLTMGISSIYDTNKLNPDSQLNDKEFLVWGNNGVDLDISQAPFTVNMSSDIGVALTTEVEFEAISRIWKVVENGGDIPEVEIQILTSAVRTATPPDGRYLMFISDSPIFNPTADYRVMTATTNELGEATLSTNYDFDNTKYITFGWAPERVFERSIFFDPADTNYVDMEDALDVNPSEFTISSWVKRENITSLNTSILSKRNVKPGVGNYTEGYDFTINTTGRFEVNWRDSGGSYRSIASSIAIPADEWHHLAIIHNGTRATLYIDGVEDTSANLAPPAATDESFYIGAAAKNTPQNFFHGNIDEVRVWDAALTEGQLHYIMNQEIEANATFVSGKYFNDISVTPTKNDVSTLPWNDLAGYYPMSTYTYTNTKDESGKGNQGALRNLRTVDRQTAPLPYQSTQNGQWDTNSTWANGSVQTIPGTTSIVDNTVSVDWNIVRTTHNVTIDDDSDLPISNNGIRSVLGLLVDNNELTVSGDTDQTAGDYDGYGLTVSHYLRLTGKIDLEGESQLIQTEDSDLLVTATGELERDQQGTSDTFTYNYWSSPVGETDAGTNRYSYSVQNVMYDNTTPINFLASGYDGTDTNPVGIADYWIWKFASQATGEYSAWQHVRRSGTILAGEGFTMKGPGSGDIADDQNYVFLGKPNNGNINLSIGADNDYLVGNPYPSAIDGRQFILDNGSVIGGTGSTTGTLYFWEHWGGGSHILAEYLGGYATYNLSGGSPSASFGVNDPDVGTGGTPRKRPGQYIPVSQGFFVTSEGSGGTINFNNGQRIFVKETASLTGNSTFMRMNNPSEDTFVDDRMKFRIGFYSVNTVQRQLLLTIDSDATVGKDWGFDGKINENQIDDMYWMIEDEKFIIQGSNEANEDSVYPLGVKVDDDGANYISINELENVPSDITVYVHDKDLNIYHNLSADGEYEVFLLAGEYNDRFEITFSNQDSLSITENTIAGVNVYYANDIESIVLRNPKNIDIKSIEMFNLLGQSIISIENISDSGYSEYEVKNLSSGTYIIKLFTVSGSVSKKVIVK